MGEALIKAALLCVRVASARDAKAKSAHRRG